MISNIKQVHNNNTNNNKDNINKINNNNEINNNKNKLGLSCAKLTTAEASYTLATI